MKMIQFVYTDECLRFKEEKKGLASLNVGLCWRFDGPDSRLYVFIRLPVSQRSEVTWLSFISDHKLWQPEIVAAEIEQV